MWFVSDNLCPKMDFSTLKIESFHRYLLANLQLAEAIHFFVMIKIWFYQ